jgi:phosphoribosyl-ATP pyrophosphohydrolase/phosphoribosyl-AMP cyclohydrolase
MKLNFQKGDGLIPAIIQDDNTGKVLMLAYMDQAALKKTRQERRVTFYSRSKKRLWTKGEVSGNYLTCKKILTDCDGDTLLIKAIPSGPVCHKGTDTCFKEKNSALNFLTELESIIADRKKNPRENSYTSRLFKEGINRIAQKVGEEATEVIIAAMESRKNRQLKDEVADLVYHLLVLLRVKGITLSQVIQILSSRHKK